MSRPSFVIDVRAQSSNLERDVRSGGLFVQGAHHPLNQDCEVTFRFDDLEQHFDARVVFSDVQGIGLELFVMPPDRVALADRIRVARGTRQNLSPPAAALEFADLAPGAARGGGATEAGGAGSAEGRDAADAGADAPGIDGQFDPGEDADGSFDDDPDRLGGSVSARRAPLLHERVRNLSVAEQLRLAQRGEHQERVLLERLYGKTVWEALLRNPRVTTAEVARIARMGALPKPLLEIIVSNAAWLQVPEVRRALLTNPRLASEMIPRVLRLLPKHELKLVPAQLAYPGAVRDVARRMLREQG
jgi:hypothetical protein